ELGGVGVGEEEGVAVVGEGVGPGGAEGDRLGFVDGQSGCAVGGRYGGRGRASGDGGEVAGALGLGAVAEAAKLLGGVGAVSAVVEERVCSELGVRGLGVELS